jgi:hypothetical protein
MLVLIRLIVLIIFYIYVSKFEIKIIFTGGQNMQINQFLNKASIFFYSWIIYIGQQTAIFVRIKFAESMIDSYMHVRNLHLHLHSC